MSHYVSLHERHLNESWGQLQAALPAPTCKSPQLVPLEQPLHLSWHIMTHLTSSDTESSSHPSHPQKSQQISSTPGSLRWGRSSRSCLAFSLGRLRETRLRLTVYHGSRLQSRSIWLRNSELWFIWSNRGLSMCGLGLSASVRLNKKPFFRILAIKKPHSTFAIFQWAPRHLQPCQFITR
jgi:hypothetical protein